MKRRITLLSIITGAITSANAAIISLPVGVGTKSIYGTIDIDNDGITDFRVSGVFICTDDVPTSACLFELMIYAGSEFQYLIDPSLGSFAKPLVDGDILGPDASPGVWSATRFFRVSVGYGISYADPEPAYSGYPGFLDGLDVYSIGYRQTMNTGEHRYGWIDVSLSRSTINGAGYPEVSVIHFSDMPGEAVTVRAIPEPSCFVFLALSGVSVLMYRVRKTSCRS